MCLVHRFILDVSRRHQHFLITTLSLKKEARQLDPSTYEPPTSMIELGPSDVVTTDATTGEESDDDEEISDE